MSKYLLESAKISNAQVGFSTLFNKQLKNSEEIIEQLAMVIPSSNETEQYNWLGAVPFMTQWLDDRKMSSLRNEKISIENLNWSNGIEVHRNEILDDKLGMVIPRIKMLADVARLHPGDTLVDLLLEGFNGNDILDWHDGLAYDGIDFFSASHVDGSGPTQDNLDTAILAHTAFDAGLTAMASLLDENSQPLRINPTHLIVGPSNRRLAKEIAKGSHRIVSDSTTGSAAIPNMDAGEVDVMISQRLVGTYAKYWFLVDLGQSVKPLIYQPREPVRFDSLSDLSGSDAAFMRAIYKYGASSRAGFGYGMWQMAYGSDGSV